MAQIYEVTGAGFNGGTDETDDRVIWVRADSEDEVKRAIEDTGATFWGELPDDGMGDDCVDFTLPGQSLNLSAALLEFAGAERNRNRC